VVAKVTRDRLMTELHERYPSYDFAVHKGYVTPDHNAALDRLGPCAEHRFSYLNVARRCRDDVRIPARTLARIDSADAEVDEVLAVDNPADLMVLF
jgi:ribonuclease HII